MATYAEKLLDPRWQQKRLRILERDKWTCQLCQDKDTTLHIHHHFYLKDYEPWDYKDEDLITYCSHCHALVEFAKTNFKDVQEIVGAFKHFINGEHRIYAYIRDTQNRLNCAIFSYDKAENKIYYDLYIPAHIITRIEFELQAIKNQDHNG